MALKHEDPLDEKLAALFRSVEAPAPSAGFASRTLKAVRRAPLPAGRRALRNPIGAAAGWASLIAGAAAAAYGIAIHQPLLATIFAALVSGGIRVGVWSTQFIGSGAAILDLLTTTAVAVSRAAATREGSAGLLLMAVIGALSLSGIHRLLSSEGEASQWQELS